MFLVIQKRRVQMTGKTWFAPEDMAQRAIAESNWPKRKVYFDWGMGLEPIHSLEELRFAARIVQAYHCHDMETDAVELAETLAETQQIEEAIELHMQAPDSDDSDGGGGDLMERELFAAGSKHC